MNSPENPTQIESREKEPTPFATVFIVRHGDTQYKEEFSDPNVEEDLTDKGKGQIQALAERINDEVNLDEKVYVMMSPRIRAKNSTEILEDSLIQKGHKVVKLGGGRPSLSNIKILDKAGADVYKKHEDKEQYLADMAEVLERLKQEGDYYLKSRAGTLENPITENIGEYRNKVKTFSRRIIEIARQRAGDNEKLVLVTHGEWLDTILELYLGHKIKKVEHSADRGEAIKVEILADKLKFNFRGQIIEVEA